MPGLKTSDVARQAGVNLETIRFYERRGLLPKPPRTRAGYRAFPPEVVRRVRFVKRAQDLGFSLNEIKDLLVLRVNPATSCGEVRRRAEEKLLDINRKIADLQRMKTALNQLAAACPGGRAGIVTCPILDSLDAEESPRQAGEKRKQRLPAVAASGRRVQKPMEIMQ